MRFTKYKIELVKESAVNYGGQDFSISSPFNLFQAMCDIYHLDRQPEEVVYLICVNTKNKIIGVHEVSRGSISASILNIRELFKRAVVNNAAKIFIVHNHPSGSTKPSEADMQVTKKAQKAGELLDIPLLDHIIIGDDEYYSFKENDQI